MTIEASGRELFKIVKDEFGGWQEKPLSFAQIRQRWCCARGCRAPGAMQFPIAPPVDGLEGYRIACAAHAVIFMLMYNSFLGDSSAIPECRELAEHMGIDFVSAFRAVRESAEMSLPEDWRCTRCSNGMKLLSELPANDHSTYSHSCTDREIEVKS